MTGGKEGKSVVRKLKNFQQKTMMGRQALKYRFEVQPYHVEGVPAEVSHVILQWRRGPKLAETEHAPVDQGCNMAIWNSKLEQVATMYRHDKNKLIHKEYTFKLQSVSVKNGVTERSTIGKAKVNLATFCSLDPINTSEVTLNMSPAGSVKLQITAQWLRNARADDDQITDMSFMSTGSDEQDLNGFDLQGSDGYTPSKSLRRTRHPTTNTPGISRAQTVPSESLKNILVDISNDADETPRPRGKRSTITLGTPADATMASSEAVETRPQDSTSKASAMKRSGPGRADSSSDTAGLPAVRRVQINAPPTPKGALGSGYNTPNSQLKHGALFGAPAVRHSRSKSDGDTLFQIEPSPRDSPVDKAHYLEMLASSDDEDSANVRWGGRIRNWFGMQGSAMKTPSQCRLNASTSAPDECPIRPEQVEGTTDPELLQHMALRLIRDYEIMAGEKRRLENKACRVQAKLEAANTVKASLVERLTHQEAQPSSTTDDLTSALVQSKLRLAEAEFSVLDLTGQLKKERERTRKLMATMTKLDTQYHVDREAHFMSSPAASRVPAELSFGSLRRTTLE